eukprot:13654154-Alexandrium_andersonii.AAC.1
MGEGDAGAASAPPETAPIPAKPEEPKSGHAAADGVTRSRVHNPVSGRPGVAATRARVVSHSDLRMGT